MRRTILIVLVLVVVAGCSTPPPTTSTTTTGQGTITIDTTTAEPTTVAPTPTPTVTNTQTTVPNTSFDASVSFPNCTAVTIDADRYSWVGIATQQDAYNHRGNYTGSRTFTTDSPIATVYISGEAGSVEVDNPAYQDCVTPDPTTIQTTVETTERVTTTEVPTTTQVVTTTTPPTTTTTMQTTQRPDISRHQISTHVENKTYGRNASAVFVVTNWNEAGVTFHYDVAWYDARNWGDDFMEDVTRKTVTLEPGESIRLVYEYEGNVSIDSIRYAVNGLGYANE